MAWYVHISTCFPAENTDESSRIAKEHLKQTHLKDEVIWMLLAFSRGEGFFTGPKGTLFNWGIIGNYTDGETCALQIMAFLEDLREYDKHDHAETGFSEYDHALVFVEEEQSEAVTVYEIKPGDAAMGLEEEVRVNLMVYKHENMPFCWGQY